MTLVEVFGVAPVVPASTLCTSQRPDGPTEHGPLYRADLDGSDEVEQLMEIHVAPEIVPNRRPDRLWCLLARTCWSEGVDT